MIRRSQPAVKNGHGRESLKICPTMSEPRLTLTLCPYIVNEWISLRRRGLNLMLILADGKIYVIITIGLSVSAFLVRWWWLSCLNSLSNTFFSPPPTLTPKQILDSQRPKTPNSSHHPAHLDLMQLLT